MGLPDPGEAPKTSVPMAATQDAGRPDSAGFVKWKPLRGLPPVAPGRRRPTRTNPAPTSSSRSTHQPGSESQPNDSGSFLYSSSWPPSTIHMKNDAAVAAIEADDDGEDERPHLQACQRRGGSRRCLLVLTHETSHVPLMTSSASIIRYAVALFGEESLTVLREIGVDGVAGDDRVEVRRPAVLLRTQHAAESLRLLLTGPEGAAHLDGHAGLGQVDREVGDLADDEHPQSRPRGRRRTVARARAPRCRP